MTCRSPSPPDVSRCPKHTKAHQRAQRVLLPRLDVDAGPAQPGCLPPSVQPGRPRQSGVRAPEQAAQAPRSALLRPAAAAAAAEVGCSHSLNAAHGYVNPRVDEGGSSECEQQGAPVSMSTQVQGGTRLSGEVTSRGQQRAGSLSPQQVQDPPHTHTHTNCCSSVLCNGCLGNTSKEAEKSICFQCLRYC